MIAPAGFGKTHLIAASLCHANKRQLVLTHTYAGVNSLRRKLRLLGVPTLAAIYDRSMMPTSFAMVMLAIAGAMALFLSIVGIYSVIAYAVVQRTREIGIRVALGAQQEAVRRMFVRHGLLLAAIGVVAGGAGAAALTRAMSSLLFGVAPVDPLTYGVVSFGLTVAVVVASYLPARRAARVDPMVALRCE